MTNFPTPAHIFGLIRQFGVGDGDPVGDSVAGLLARLKGEDSVDRLEAAQKLAWIEPPVEEAVALLRRRLDHHDDGVRFDAACGLGCFPTAFPVLHAMLHDEDAGRRALGAIGISCSYRATEAALDLIRLLDDPAAEVRSRTLDALRQIVYNEDVHAAASAVPRIAALLHDVDEGTRSRAAEALSAFGSEAAIAVPDLTGLLRHSDESVRSEAVRVLGCIGESAASAVPDLMRLLRSPLALDRAAAAETLGCIGPAAAASQAELARLGDAEPEDRVRESALEALARLGSPETIDE